jgi:uncharacterized damage-inducible protein DinB
VPGHGRPGRPRRRQQWEGPGYNTILYAVDNEPHHRAQGHVYLRALGVEPPPFFDRS